MRESRRVNFIIVGALLAIAVSLIGYAALVLRWFEAPHPQTHPSALTRAAAATELVAARSDFRRNLLDARAHLRLSEALWRAGRPVDSFYVLYNARKLFSGDEFLRAHAEIVLGAGGPAAEERDHLFRGAREPALLVPKYAELARDYPDSPEGRDALSQLSRLASGDENAPGGDAAHLAMMALRQLSHAEPGDPARFTALADAYLGRSQETEARALASEMLEKRPGQAGAAHVMGFLALKSGDVDSALAWLTQAWEANPSDLPAAAELARLYDKRRNDPESSLPFYLAVYRRDPGAENEGPVELRVREILDARREDLLRGVPVEGLGRRFHLDDASLRAEACLRASAFKDPRWIDVLGDLLDDDTEIVRQSADYALYKIAQAEPTAVRARRELWLSSDKPLVRVRALNLFADLDGRNAFPSVIQALADPDPAVRAYAKVMVLDHYYRGLPQARAAERRYLAWERDRQALNFERRWAETR